MDSVFTGHQDSKPTKDSNDLLSINKDIGDSTIIDSNGFNNQENDAISISTLDISLCQAYEEVFGHSDVLHMVVPPDTDLFQQPFYIQSSEDEIDFIPPLDIQLHQAYKEIFDDPDVSTMLSIADEGLFHQPFHLQPDEYEIDFDNTQGHEPIKNENRKDQSCLLSLNAIEDLAFPHFTICHDLGEINVKNHPGTDGETHLGLDEGKYTCKQDIVTQVNGETQLHNIVY
ncbi:hypothetical protein ACA910_004264 [Epithemia clementina (nom. ined.)]